MFTPIQTKRLTLRRLVTDDAQAVHAYRSDPIVVKFQSWKPRTLSETKSFLEQLAQVEPNRPGTWLQLGLETKTDKTLIGDCGIRFPADDSFQVELGMTLMPACQGQGMASEALQAILDYVFGQLDKHRVFASIDPRNESAIRLMNRAGMRQEAHFRKSLLIDGEWVDDLIFAILASEWREKKQAG